MEMWLSGRKRRPAKTEVADKVARRFKSFRLREKQITIGGVSLIAKAVVLKTTSNRPNSGVPVGVRSPPRINGSVGQSDRFFRYERKCCKFESYRFCKHPCGQIGKGASELNPDAQKRVSSSPTLGTFLKKVG